MLCLDIYLAHFTSILSLRPLKLFRLWNFLIKELCSMKCLAGLIWKYRYLWNMWMEIKSESCDACKQNIEAIFSSNWRRKCEKISVVGLTFFAQFCTLHFSKYIASIKLMCRHYFFMICPVIRGFRGNHIHVCLLVW